MEWDDPRVQTGHNSGIAPALGALSDILR